MQYKFETVRQNYAPLSSGSVIYSFPGQPAFPVRLSSEIFQRCLLSLKKDNNNGPYALYDPLCGGGYLITCLGLLNSKDISAIYGSDINPRAVNTTALNLKLLTFEGLNERTEQLKQLYRSYSKDSHKEAIENAEYISQHFLTAKLDKISKKSFEADAFDSNCLTKEIDPGSMDIVITDLPYGKQTDWVRQDANILELKETIPRLLNAIGPVVKKNSVVALVGEKIDKRLIPSNYLLVEHFKVGLRHVSILKLINNC